MRLHCRLQCGACWLAVADFQADYLVQRVGAARSAWTSLLVTAVSPNRCTTWSKARFTALRTIHPRATNRTRWHFHVPRPSLANSCRFIFIHLSEACQIPRNVPQRRSTQLEGDRREIPKPCPNELSSVWSMASLACSPTSWSI
jgi:hypothetical protein